MVLGRLKIGADLGLAPVSDTAFVRRIGEIAPMHPAAFWTVKPPVAQPWAGDEKGGAWPGVQLDAVRRSGSAQHNVAGLARGLAMNAAGGDGVLDVAAVEQEARIDPWMIVQRAVIV